MVMANLKKKNTLKPHVTLVGISIELRPTMVDNQVNSKSSTFSKGRVHSDELNLELALHPS